MRMAPQFPGNDKSAIEMALIPQKTNEKDFLGQLST
jgi:hypothetical protein